MKRIFNLKFTPNVLLTITFIVAIFVSFFQINPAIDTGREFYIPLRILNGDILYKDIFNIYGPLSYQINALAYMALGIGVNSLRFLGILNSCLIIFLYMLVCKEIFPKDREKFVVNGKNCYLEKNNGIWQYAVIPLVVGVGYIGVFNYTIPYSYAMTYGLSAFLASLYYFIKFSKSNIIEYAYFACLFAGFAIACKYDFILYSLFLCLTILVNRKITTKQVFNSLFFMILIPFASYGVLFLQGLSFENLSETFQTISQMSRTTSLRYFYSNYAGTYFKLFIFIASLIRTLIFAVVIMIVVFARNVVKNDRFLTCLLYIFAILSLFFVNLQGYSLIAVINALILFLYRKKIFENKPIFVLMLTSVLFSFKTFFSVNIDVYGTYTLPLILLSLMAFARNIDYSDRENIREKVKYSVHILIIGLMILCVTKSFISIISKINGVSYIKDVKNPNNVVERVSSLVYFYPQIARTINETSEYIKNNTSENDVIVIFPETMYLNFITGRKADNLYDSLTPMYFETFGEEKIINHFEETAPEYIIINNRNTSDYGKKYICNDYGRQFCKFVEKNYKVEKTFGTDSYIMKMYKRKNL